MYSMTIASLPFPIEAYKDKHPAASGIWGHEAVFATAALDGNVALEANVSAVEDADEVSDVGRPRPEVDSAVAVTREDLCAQGPEDAETSPRGLEEEGRKVIRHEAASDVGGPRSGTPAVYLTTRELVEIPEEDPRFDLVEE